MASLIAQALMPRPMPPAIAAAQQQPAAPFVWGADGTPITADQLARNRKLSDALRPTKDPTGPWSLLGDLADQGVAGYRDSKDNAAEADARKAVADALANGKYQDVIANDMATPGQDTIASALWSDQRQKADPAYQLDLQVKRAQLAAAQNRQQPIINAGSGQLYDPNSKTWITPPSVSAAADQPVVGFGADGLPDPAAQDAYLQTLDPKYAAIVKGVANYELDPAKVTSLRGDLRQKLVEDAKAYDPTYDGTQYGVRSQVRKSFTSGSAAQALNSANVVIGHLHELAKASQELGNQGFTPWNVVANGTKQVFGDPTPTTYGIAAQASADELAKVFKGTGASDVESIRGWQTKLDQNASPQQQQAAIHEAVALLQSRIAALRDQYQNATGKPANFGFLNVKSAAALKDMGIDPQSVDPNYVDPHAAGAAPAASAAVTAPPAEAPVYATNPQTGERLMLKDGQWVPAQ